MFGWFRKKEEETFQKPKRRSENLKVQQSNKWKKKKIKNLLGLQIREKISDWLIKTFKLYLSFLEVSFCLKLTA